MYTTFDLIAVAIFCFTVGSVIAATAMRIEQLKHYQIKDREIYKLCDKIDTQNMIIDNLKARLNTRERKQADNNLFRSF